MIRKFTTFFLFAFLISATLYGQVVTINLEAYGITARDVAFSTTDIYTAPATGLTNVGVGTLNYIKATIDGKVFENPSWSFTRRPSGSSATVGTDVDVKDDNTQVFTFRPDKAGVYELTLTDGAYSSSIVFNSAKFLGYQNTVVNGVDTKLSCQTCHSSIVTEWQGTNHATMFTRAMQATPGLSGPADHYSANCISCHTTGYNTDTLAVNDGFDDFDFVYPAKVKPTTWDSLLVANPKAMLRANIQCEDCHGPASGHLGVTTDSRMEATFSADVCAYCHDSGTHHIFPYQYKASKHSITVDESGPGREACVRCHTGKGFAQYAEGVATNDPYFDPSYTPITCQACHDPHDATNIHQLRKVEAELLGPDKTTIKVDESTVGTAAICFNCHQSRTEANAALTGSINSRFGPHHGPQGDMLLSNNMLALGGVALQKSGHLGATGDACVKCHMYSGDAVTGTTVNQWGGHSFSMYTFKKDANDNFILDDQGNRIPDKDNMEACSQCHGNTFGSSFESVYFSLNNVPTDYDGNGIIEGLQTEVKGMIAKIMDEIKAETGSTTPSSSWSKEQLSAFWNATTAQEDKSFGIHNPKYIVTALLGAMKSIGIVTAVETDEQTIPSTYTLFQNYPNPFNPTTNIRFAIPKASNVKVTIYDAIGKEVITLVNNELNAGTHTISWNASGLASGIYLYRIVAGNFVQVNKMLLLK